jgi:cell filamentation protein
VDCPISLGFLLFYNVIKELQKFTIFISRGLEYDADHKFSADDIRHMHEVWLGDIYDWAGQYRRVNISKGDFVFAMVAQIPKLMTRFEIEQLAKYTPCSFTDRNDVIKALAEIHTELVLIHPFREGNGRCSRILASIMALQAGLPVPGFRLMSGSKKSGYFMAVQHGLDRTYGPMEKLFSGIIERSIQALSE